MQKIKNRILGSRAVRKIVLYSKRLKLPGSGGIPVYDILAFLFKQASLEDMNERAAAISFNSLMAFPGVLIFLCTLVPILPDAEQVRFQLLVTLDDVIKDNTLYNLASTVINDFFSSERSGLMWFSILFVIFFSSRAMLGIMDSFDQSYFEDRSKHFMAKRWQAFKLTFFFIVLLIVTLLVLATQGDIKSLILGRIGLNYWWMEEIIDYSRWLIIFSLNFFTVGMIYRYAPAIKNKWSLFSPGTVLATLLMILFTWLFSVYVANFANYNKVYGSIGTVIILMNIVFINSLILLVGFELNASITRLKKQAAQRIEEENRAEALAEAEEALEQHR